MAQDAAGMRASDAERDVVMSQLGVHFKDGRLDNDEFNERLEAAAAARTRGELAALLTDLPTTAEPWASAPSAVAPAPGAPAPGAPAPGAPGMPGAPAPAVPGQQPVRWMPVAAGVLVVMVISGVVATAVGGRHGYWFPWWIIPVTFLIIRRIASRGYSR